MATASAMAPGERKGTAMVWAELVLAMALLDTDMAAHTMVQALLDSDMAAHTMVLALLVVRFTVGSASEEDLDLDLVSITLTDVSKMTILNHTLDKPASSETKLYFFSDFSTNPYVVDIH